MTEQRRRAGSIEARPNPALGDTSGMASVTLYWSSEGTEAVEVRVGAPDGPLLSHTGGSGCVTTGNWVHDGMSFYLQDLSADASLTAEHTLATVSIRVDRPSDAVHSRALILLYHRVAEPRTDPWSLCVRPQHFAEHLAVLKDRWHAVPLSELVRTLAEGRVPDRAVALTFDDGYADNLRTAMPLLENWEAPATFFVASGYVGGEREFWWDELEQLSWRGGALDLGLYASLHRLLRPLAETERRQILDRFREWTGDALPIRASYCPLSAQGLAQLAASPLVEIGSHTFTHAHLPTLNEAQQRAEIQRCKARLEELLNRRVDAFSYPYGCYTEATLRIVQSAGLTCACTTHAGAVDKYCDRFRLPRFTVQDCDGAEFARRLSTWHGSRTQPARETVTSAAPHRDRGTDEPHPTDKVLEQSAAQQLRQAEEVRQQVVAGVRAFRTQFDSALRTYRNQRAWRAMLLLRKAYTILAQKRDINSFLKWIALLPRESASTLAPYDLVFPSVESYLPAALQFPLSVAPTEAVRVSATRRVPRQTKYDVIVLPVFEFDYRFQRPQQLAIQFAGNGHRVFWVSPSRRPPASAREDFEVVPLRENLYEVHLRGPCPNIYADKLTNSGALLESLAQLYAEWAIAESAVMVELPFWRPVAQALREAYGAIIVFDCMDDWESMPAISEFNRTEERRLVRECDLLVLTARQLVEKHVHAARRFVLAPNAADFGFFSAPDGNRDSIARVPKPVVGYFGAIAEWFNYDLLERVVASRPQYSFVLLGALGLEENVLGEQVVKLRKFSNVFLMGHKPYNELPSSLQHFDACIVPFVINEVTRATDPVKVYEYLSQGKPVVATAMPELFDRAELIYIAEDSDDFTRKLDQAVSESDRELRRRRLAYAARNTWQDRFRTIDNALRETAPLVSILIVTHNSQEFAGPCMESLFRNTSYPNYEILIVDNGSSDETPRLLREYAGAEPRIRYTALPDNRGFASANNVAAREATGDYLVFLNIDTMVSPGWLGRLIRGRLRDARAGMVVPVTNWAGNEARINTEYTNFQEMEEFAVMLAQRNLGRSVELAVAPLFCALVPRSVWTQVGELDERFEVGMFEDDDFSLRVRRLDYRIVTAEDCFVHHFGRGSFSKMSPDEYQRIFDQNLRRFEEKWRRPWTPHQSRPGITAEFKQYDPIGFAAQFRGV